MKVSTNIGKEVHDVPWVYGDIVNHNLADTDYAASGVELKKGVYFKAHTTGTYRMITLNQWFENGGETHDASDPASGGERNTILRDIVSAGKYVDHYMVAGQIVETPIVYIDKATRPAGSSRVSICKF